MMYFTHFVEPYRCIGFEQRQFDVLKNICRSDMLGIDGFNIIRTIPDPKIHFVKCKACTVLKKRGRKKGTELNEECVKDRSLC